IVSRILEPDHVVEFGRVPGLDSQDFPFALEFDDTGVFGDKLFMTVINYENGLDTELFEIESDGTIHSKGIVGSDGNAATCTLAFTDGSGGYIAGSYMLDSQYDGGTNLWHADSSFQYLKLEDNALPPGRNDLDPYGDQFDPTGLHGGYYTVADND